MKFKIWLVTIASLFYFACNGSTNSTKVTIDVIAVTPLQSLISIGDTIQFTAVAKDVNLETINGVGFTWTSSDQEVVSIDDNGLATGLAMGRDVVITAAAEGIESNDAVLKVAGEPYTINIGSTAEAVVAGKTVSLHGKVLDSLGTEIPGSSITSWESGDESILTVDGDGVVTGVLGGMSSVVAHVGELASDPKKIYVWHQVFSEDFSTVDTTTIGDHYFSGHNGMIWQINHELKTDTSASGPHTGTPAIVNDNGNPVLRLTDPSSAYFTNRQMLIMTYGNATYDTGYMWPTGDNMLTGSNFRVQMRMKGMDDPVAGTTAETLVIFTQYFSGAASPYYMNFAPGRNRLSAWFGASLAPGATIPDWGSIPQIDYGVWFNVVVEVFDGSMRAEIYTGTEPTGDWDYTYTIPDWTGNEENIPGFWFGTFLVDEYYADDIVYYTP